MLNSEVLVTEFQSYISREFPGLRLDRSRGESQSFMGLDFYFDFEKEDVFRLRIKTRGFFDKIENLNSDGRSFADQMRDGSFWDKHLPLVSKERLKYLKYLEDVQIIPSEETYDFKARLLTKNPKLAIYAIFNNFIRPALFCSKS